MEPCHDVIVTQKRNTPRASRLLVVIVNYRTPGLTLDCLRSLAPEIPSVSGTRCVVVDNASDDDSLQLLEQARQTHGWQSWLDIVASDRNRGFAGGNNLGIAHGEPAQFVLLLNSDTLVERGCLLRCLKVMEQDVRIGAMSCRVLNRDHTIQNVARRFPTPLRVTCAAIGLPWRLPSLFGWANLEDPGWDRERRAKNVDWLGGAFLFVRASALGGTVRLDEDFFFYGEDVAFCHRLTQLGWRCYYDAERSIVHLGGASSDPSRLPTAERSIHVWRGRYLIQRKCYGRWAELWVRALDMTTTTARLAKARLGAGSDPKEVEGLRRQLETIRTIGQHL